MERILSQLVQHVNFCIIYKFFFCFSLPAPFSGSDFYLFYMINYTEFMYFCTDFLQLAPNWTKVYGYETKNMAYVETNTVWSSNPTNLPGSQ